jgi:hypothetical protein
MFNIPFGGKMKFVIGSMLRKNPVNNKNLVEKHDQLTVVQNTAVDTVDKSKEFIVGRKKMIHEVCAAPQTRAKI